MMRITELLGSPRCVSIELWPPRNPAAEERLEAALVELEALRPAFISITYGAGGSTRQRTHDLVMKLADRGGSVPMAHLVCAAHSRAELAEILGSYHEAGLENVLALRGDPPLSGGEGLAEGELAHAIELVRLAKQVGGFCVGVAAHPEGHPDSPDRASDLAHLAAKLEIADFAITQFFFEVSDYLSLVDEISKLGVRRPIVPGVMPITSARTVGKMAEMSGSKVPERLAARIEAAADRPDDVIKIGVEVATQLCDQLLAEGVPGLHFYTMNQSRATIEVCCNLGLGSRVA
jgi:methylenetetrahydrofolate reductase (NADPH)